MQTAGSLSWWPSTTQTKTADLPQPFAQYASSPKLVTVIGSAQDSSITARDRTVELKSSLPQAPSATMTAATKRVGVSNMWIGTSPRGRYSRRAA
jgi:hypothetical protein